MKKTIFLFLLFLFICISFVGTIKARVPEGNYLELRGGYLIAENPNELPLSGFTFEAWIKPLSVSGYTRIFSAGKPEMANPYYEVGINGGSLSFIISSLGYFRSQTAGNIRADVWSHIAVMADLGTSAVFINGKKVSGEITVNNNLEKMGNNIILGSSHNPSTISSGNFKGDLDEVRVSRIARDISSLWSSGFYAQKLSSDTHTILLYHLDELRGETVAKDYSAESLDAQLIGGDSRVHFQGVVPTATSFPKPTSRFSLPPLPTIFFSRPTLGFPGTNLTPTPVFPGGPTITVTPSGGYRDNPRPTRASHR